MAIVKAAVSVTVVGPRPSYSDSKNNRISPTTIASSALIRHLKCSTARYKHNF